MEFLQIIQEYGPYVGLPIVIHYLVNGLKQIPFFKKVIGIRLIHFLPVILGMAGGFLLPEDTWQAKILVGGALGCLNLLIYKTLTVTMAKTSVIQEKIDAKTSSADKED
jgi:hypothetical protein